VWGAGGVWLGGMWAGSGLALLCSCGVGGVARGCCEGGFGIFLGAGGLMGVCVFLCVRGRVRFRRVCCS